jgi:AraC-like DNA-binding protein
VNRRTLDRRLREEGTSFQHILDEVHFETACQLLENTELPINDIAVSVGYSQSSAFTRAFRRWCSVGPSRWRLNESRASLS